MTILPCAASSGLLAIVVWASTKLWAPLILARRGFRSSARAELVVPGLGALRGRDFGDGTAAYLNIPFALPPVGPQRFCPPVPIGGWPSVLDASQFGPSCIQEDSKGPVSEDCLSLNIWAPAVAAKLLPVFVFVHGGGLVSGSAADYDGTRITENEGMVTVTLNYRLGALGFYASEELSAQPCMKGFGATGGMNGALDVLEGLRWVRQHIGNFGGDPDKITLGGESGGSQIVCFLAHSEHTADLNISAFIFESGSCVGPWGPMTTEDSFAASSLFYERLRHSDSHSELFGNGRGALDVLRDLPASALNNSVVHFEQQPSKVAGVDRWFLRDLPSNIPLQGVSAPQSSRALIGTDDLDSTCVDTHSTDSVNGWATANYSSVVATLSSAGFGDEDAKEIVDYYLAHTSLARPVCDAVEGIAPPISLYTRLFWEISRDVGVACPNLRLAQKFAAAGSQKSYLYWHWHSIPTLACDLAVHGGELALLFDWYGEFLPLTKYVQDHWKQFIAVESIGGWKSVSIDSMQEFMHLTWPAPHGGQGYGDYFACSFWSNYTTRGRQHLTKYNRFGWLC